MCFCRWGLWLYSWLEGLLPTAKLHSQLLSLCCEQCIWLFWNIFSLTETHRFERHISRWLVTSVGLRHVIEAAICPRQKNIMCQNNIHNPVCIYGLILHSCEVSISWSDNSLLNWILPLYHQKYLLYLFPQGVMCSCLDVESSRKLMHIEVGCHVLQRLIHFKSFKALFPNLQTSKDSQNPWVSCYLVTQFLRDHTSCQC